MTASNLGSETILTSESITKSFTAPTAVARASSDGDILIAMQELTPDLGAKNVGSGIKVVPQSKNGQQTTDRYDPREFMDAYDQMEFKYEPSCVDAAYERNAFRSGLIKSMVFPENLEYTYRSKIEQDLWNKINRPNDMVHKTKPGLPPKVASDLVENSYYDTGGISTIDVIKAKLTPEQYKGFLLGNVIKYSLRINWKGYVSSDAKKIKKYSIWLSDYETQEKGI